MGLVLTDLAVQAGHVTSLGVVYKLVAADARSRATTVYMTCVFLGGAGGSAAAAAAYGRAGWHGTASVCAVLAGAALLLWVVRLRVTAPVLLEDGEPDDAWPESVV